MRRGVLGLLAILVGGCAMHQPPRAAWDAEARRTAGEVHVLPVVSVVRSPDLRLDGYLASEVGLERELQRRHRTRQLEQVPAAVGQSVPGAVGARVGPEAQVYLRPARWRLGSRDRLVSALRRADDPSEALAGIGRRLGEDAVLITWVNALEGRPLTAEALPGEIVPTAAGPVLVDFGDEAYSVRTEVGVAVVAGDGEVVVRYVDHYEAVLSSHEDSRAVGRRLAIAVADEVAKLWPASERLQP